MREIKFRAWDGTNMELPIYDVSIQYGNKKLMQYTGLKDKNGVEIYEGDIIKFSSNGYGNGKAMVVEWDKEFAGFLPFAEQIFQAADSYSEWEIESTKVIGNIYENPELLLPHCLYL